MDCSQIFIKLRLFEIFLRNWLAKFHSKLNALGVDKQIKTKVTFHFRSNLQLWTYFCQKTLFDYFDSFFRTFRRYTLDYKILVIEGAIINWTKSSPIYLSIMFEILSLNIEYHKIQTNPSPYRLKDKYLFVDAFIFYSKLKLGKWLKFIDIQYGWVYLVKDF